MSLYEERAKTLIKYSKNIRNILEISDNEFENIDPKQKSEFYWLCFINAKIDELIDELENENKTEQKSFH